MLRHAGLLALTVAAMGCTCGEKQTPTDSMSQPQGATTRTLAKLPDAPALSVPPEALSGAGKDLAVVAARPQGEQQGEVRPTVTFSRPVKSLEMVEAARAADAARPFAKIDPPIEGEWRWLGSASAEFVPKGNVAFSSTYTVTVFKGLVALDGAALQEDYAFSFTTPRLTLQDLKPAREDRWVTPESTINLLFNQPVNKADLEAGLLFKVNGESRPLRVTKEVSIAAERRAELEATRNAGGPALHLGDEALRARNQQTRYTLEPTQPLPLGASLSLAFDPTLHGTQGPLTRVEPEPITWATYGKLVVESASFCAGDSKCSHGPLVIMTSNGVELDTLKSRLRVTPAVELDWESAQVYVPDSDWELRERRPSVSVPGRFKPGTQYTIEIAAGVADLFKQASAQPLKVTLKTDDLSPALISGGSVGVVEATKDAPKVPVEVSNLKTLLVRMWKLSIPELAKTLAQAGHEQRPLIARAPDFTESEQLQYPLNEARVHPLDLSKVLGAQAKSGVALVSVDSPELERENRPADGYRQVVLVTDLAAHIKIGPTSSLAWVTRLSNGAVVADADVTVHDETGAQLWAGKTNAEGFADVPGAIALKLRPAKNSWEYPFALVVAQKDGDLSATANTWAGGVEPYEFGLSQGWEGERPESASFLFSDRGIYRPGDEVFLKGVVRYRVLGQLRAPSAGSALTLTVTDSKDQQVKVETVTVTKFGTFSAKALIPKDAPTGGFSVSAKGLVGGGEVALTGGFRVEEYRAPQFRVDVEPAVRDLIAGEALEANVFARYLFGGAMSEVPVKWSVQRNSTQFVSERAPGFTFAQQTWWWDDSAPHEASGFFASGEGRADAKGTMAVKAGLAEAPAEQPYVYTLEAEATDVNRQAVAGRASVTVHPASVYVGLRSSTYFLQVGTEYPLDTVVVDSAGKPVAGSSVAVTVTSRTWKSVKKKDATGGFTTVSEPEEKEVHTCTLRSADLPVPCPFKPAAAGFFIVRAQVKDERGPVARQLAGRVRHGERLGGLAAQRHRSRRADTRQDLVRRGRGGQGAGEVALPPGQGHGHRGARGGAFAAAGRPEGLGRYGRGADYRRDGAQRVRRRVDHAAPAGPGRAGDRRRPGATECPCRPGAAERGEEVKTTGGAHHHRQTRLPAARSGERLAGGQRRRG
jgi:hypothetical protein